MAARAYFTIRLPVDLREQPDKFPASKNVRGFPVDVPRGGKINIPKIFFSEKRQQDFPINPDLPGFFCLCWDTA